MKAVPTVAKPVQQRPVRMRCCYCKKVFGVQVLLEARANCPHCGGLHLRCARCKRFRPPRSDASGAPARAFATDRNGQWCYECNNETRRGRTNGEYLAASKLCEGLLALLRQAESDGLLATASTEFRQRMDSLYRAAANHNSISLE